MKHLKGKKILVIDDTDPIRSFLRVYMQGMGAIVSEANTGQRGIDSCKEVEPDVVILDLGLPDMDGLNVLNEVRNINFKNKPIIIVLTVRKGEGTMKESYQLGADAFMNKPFMVEDLIDVLREKVAE